MELSKEAKDQIKELTLEVCRMQGASGEHIKVISQALDGIDLHERDGDMKAVISYGAPALVFLIDVGSTDVKGAIVETFKYGYLLGSGKIAMTEVPHVFE